MATTKKFLQAAAGVGGGAQEPDEFFNQTTLLLHGDGTQGGQNNTFLDESPNAFQITRNGNATQGSFSPFGDRWSNYFAADGDNVSVPSNTATTLGTGDFTMEAWVYMTTASLLEYGIFGIDTTGGPIFEVYDQKLYLGARGTAYDLGGNIDVPINTWTHLAITRSSGTVNLWQNGALVGSGTVTRDYPSGTGYVATFASAARSFPGYIADLRVIKGTALYTSAFTPPTEPLTAVSGTSLLTCQSNRFKDNSSNNFTLTPNGTPSVTKFSPYAPSGTYIPAPPDINAVAFDGDGDYLSTPTSSDFELTGDFTVELWYYRKNNTTTEQGIFSLQPTAGTSGLRITDYDDGKLRCILIADGFTLHLDLQSSSADALVANAWSHIAFTRSGSDCRTFINGVLDQSGTSSSWTGTGLNALIGAARNYNSGALFDAHATISNVRVVKGTAVYTSAFTPPTEPLTAISGTSLLTCQDGFVDNSTNGFTITTNGNPQLTEFGPFGAGDGYWSNGFDGDDHLSFTNTDNFGTSDFTIEAWIYYNDTQSFDSAVIDGRPVSLNTTGWLVNLKNTGKVLRFAVGTNVYDSTTSISPAEWTHIALTYTGSTLRSFINGQLDSTWTGQSFNLTDTDFVVGKAHYINSNWIGGISNLRLVKGTALYTANFTPSTTPLTAVAGTSLLTCQSNRFVDNSSNAFALTAGGDPEVLAANPFDDNIPEEVGSGYFVATGDYLAAPDATELDFGTGDFTIEAWVYKTSGTDFVIFASQPTGSNTFFYGIVDNSRYSIGRRGSGYDLDYGYSPPLNVWQHYAVTRSGTTARLFINGQIVTSGTVTTDYFTGPYQVGGFQQTDAYFANVRIVKGTALYTAAFTPPAQPLTPVPNTSLLLNFDNAEIYDSTGMNDLETVGNAQIDTSVVKYGTGSLKFDGSDFLRSTNGVFQLGSGDFTIEHWIYLPDAATLQGIFRIWDGSNQANYSTDLYIVSGQFSWDVKSGATVKAVTANTSIASNTWTHVALTRYQNELAMYIDGVKQTDTEDATGFDLVYTNFELGTHYGTLGETTYAFTGYIDDFRITKGVARYTANFTPPAQAFPDQ